MQGLPFEIEPPVTSPVQPSPATGPVPPLTSGEKRGEIVCQPCKGPFVHPLVHPLFLRQTPIRALLCSRPCFRHGVRPHAGTLPAGGLHGVWCM